MKIVGNLPVQAVLGVADVSTTSDANAVNGRL
jgi:hypothetical protein